MAQFYGDFGIAGNGTMALVSFETATKISEENTKVVLNDKDKSTGFISWGANNDFPQKLLNEVRKNGAARSGLRVSRKAHYGSGFILAKESHQEGKRVIEHQSISAHELINSFWKKNKMARFWLETIVDLEYFAIAFPEYILSKDYKTINRVRRQQTSFCRFSAMNEDTRSVEYVYISAKWDQNPSLDSKDVDKIPLIDSYWSADEVKAYCKANGITKFVRPIFYPLLDESYYPSPEWHAALKSGWLDMANSIPIFKKAHIENQLNIKFLIEVSEDYFERKYKEDWSTFSPEKRTEIRTEFLDTIDNALRDPQNAGKSIMSMAYKDDTGQNVSGLKITAVDNPLKDGSYLSDTSAGNQELLTAIGVDPSLIGAGIPGGKLGAGSGSDKREAWFILSALMKTNRETTLDTFEFLRDYNQWGDDLIGAFEDTILTTLDKNPTGTQKTAQI